MAPKYPIIQHTETIHAVACVPFEKHGIQAKVQSNGLVVGESYHRLTPLKVLVAFSTRELTVSVGDTVYVRGKDNMQSWAKEILESDAHGRFILVPVQSVVMATTSRMDYDAVSPEAVVAEAQAAQ